MAGLGVRHGQHRGVAAEGGAPAAGLDRLGLLLPGWRRWVWRSTSPGATTQPPASSTAAPSRPRAAGRGRPRRRSVPSGPTATSASRPPVRSITRPPLITTRLCHMLPSASSSWRYDAVVGPGGPARRRRSELGPARRGSRIRTAMRTATPLRTWSTITGPGRSATSAAISTPAVHRAGVHHQRVRRAAGRPGAGREAVAAACTRAATG